LLPVLGCEHVGDVIVVNGLPENIYFFQQLHETKRVVALAAMFGEERFVSKISITNVLKTLLVLTVEPSLYCPGSNCLVNVTRTHVAQYSRIGIS